MTKFEFDQLPSDRKHACPDCGLKYTTPYPNCGCPTVYTAGGYPYAQHINQWHHNCEDAKQRHKEALERRYEGDLEDAFYLLGRSL